MPIALENENNEASEHNWIISTKGRRIDDLTGRKFGMLTVLRRANDKIEPSGKHTIMWVCECECGTIKTIHAQPLRDGRVVSCGCYRNALTKERSKRYNTYDLSGDAGIGYTNSGYKFYFDLEDYDRIKEFCWTEDKDGYLTCRSENSMRMHRLLCPDLSRDMLVDHINGIPYDNRKSNLRPVTTFQNAMNHAPRKNWSNRDDVRGIKQENGKFAAYITVNKELIKLGKFETLDEAMKIRSEAEDKYFGEYSYRASRTQNTDAWNGELPDVVTDGSGMMITYTKDTNKEEE